MHEIYELKEKVINELKEFGNHGDLSRGDLPTIDMLAHTAKNLCKVIEICEDITGYSMRDDYSNRDNYSNRDGYSSRYYPDYYNRNYSMARGRGRNASRDSMGRYSSDNDWMVDTLTELKEKAPNDKMRMEFDEFISRMERMK